MTERTPSETPKKTKKSDTSSEPPSSGYQPMGKMPIERSGSSDHSSGRSRSIQAPEAAFDDLPPELEVMLQGLPPDKRAELIEVVQATSHQGWLPPPTLLREYNDVLPGLAERIVRMPEREQEHRHKLIETVTSDDARLKRRGQNFAMASLVLLLCFAGALLVAGYPDWAAKVAMFGIVGVVGIFVTGRWADAKIAKEHATDADE